MCAYSDKPERDVHRARKYSLAVSVYEEGGGVNELDPFR